MRRARVLAGVVVAALAASLLPAGALRAADDAEPAPGPWEEVVFLPESALAVLLERDPRGVLLDRASYVDLHRRARASRDGASRGVGGPPLSLLRCDVTGEVRGDVAHLKMRLAVASREDGRNTLALPVGGSVVSATLDGSAATLGADAAGVLSLVVAGRGVHEAVVDVVVPAYRDQGRRSLAVVLPAAPAVRWRLDVPGRVTATVEEGLSRVERLADPERTRLVAFGASTLRASWREGDEGTDLPPLVRATVHTLAEVGERALDVTALVHIECARSPRDVFAVDLPGDLLVLGVDGASLVATPGSASSHVLRFAEPFTGAATVLIRAARALSGPGETTVPVVAMPDAATLERRVAVRFRDGLRGVVTAGEGAVRLDPARSEQGAVDALLRIDGDARPVVRSERPGVSLRADVRVLVDLADDGPWLAASFLYRPRGDRLYGVDPLLPEGFLPETIEVVPPREILRGTTPDGRLTLVFPGGVEAGGAVTVTVRGRWPVPGWTDEAWSEGGDERDAPLPRLDAGTAVEAEGLLGVAVPAGVEVRDDSSPGLLPAPVTELRERGGFAAEGLTLGWRFRGATEGGRLRVTRPAASLTAAVAILATPAEDHVTVDGSVALTVQRSGVREVRLRVDPPLGDLVRIDGPDVAEERRERTDGHDTWTVRFTRLVRDGTTIRLRADLPLVDHAAAVPSVRVENVARHDLHVGVAAAGELEVTTESTGLVPADAADLALALGASPAGLLRAWRAERDGTPALTVTATRLPASPLPTAFADSVGLRTVLGMDGIARTRLDAMVRNVDRQALEVVLPDGARLSSARVAGEAVRPVRTRSGALLVPIVPSAQPFPVVLVYEEAVPAGASSASLVAPDLGIAGATATWTVYLPEGSLPVATTGDFAVPPVQPGLPLVLRAFRGMRVVEKGMALAGGESVRMQMQVAPGAAAAPRRVADKDREMADELVAEDAQVEEEVAPASRDPRAPPAPVAPGAGSGGGGVGGAGGDAGGSRRIAARAAQRGLFGMDIRLLAEGPTVTATRLGPTGSLDVTWRTASSRSAAALFCGLLAFIGGLVARRRGVGAFPWTVLALAAFTALPIAFGAADTASWDGAAAGTLWYALFAFLHALIRFGGRVLSRLRLPRLRARAAAVGLLVLLCTVPALARGGKAAPPPPGVPSPDRVYVPYDPDRPETMRTPERVFLHYDRYRELWNRAHPEERIEATLAPVLVAASYTGRVEERVLVVAVRYEVDPADGGLVALPPGAAVDDVRIDDVPVATTAAAPGGATLVPVGKGAPGARVALTATLRWPVGGAAPGGIISGPLPRVPSCTLTLDVPLADAVVAITAWGGHDESAEAGGTRIAAALGPVDKLELSWRPRGADAAGGRTRYEVETEVAATLRPRLVEWTADVLVRSLAGTVQELDAQIPAGLELQSVEGPTVASWTVVAGRVLRVRLVGVTAGEFHLLLRGFARRTADSDAVSVPGLAVAGASADRLRLTVAAADARLAVESSAGMERTDAPAGALSGALAFRRVRADGALSVRTEPLPGGLGVAARQHLHLGADASLLRCDLDLTPGPGGLFETRVALPDGWDLDDAAGAATFTEGRAVRLVFSGASTAARTVTLRLRGPAWGDDARAVPILVVDGALRQADELLVSTAPGFAATAAGAEGADSVPAEQFAGWPALAPVELRALAWRAPRGGATIRVQRETLRPTSRPTVIADITVLDDRAIVDALVHFDVRGGPERVFVVDAPVGVRDAWVLAEGLREVRRETVDGRERLTVTMQAAATGAVAFRVLYELEVPASGEIVVVGPEPVGAETTRAFLMLRALGDAEVRVGDAATLETCDVADLPLLPEGLDPLRVLRFMRARDAAWRLPLVLAAHELGDLPDARIHLVESTMVVDRDGSGRTRMIARLFNRARGFLPVSLPEGAVLESVLVAGAPVRPVVRADEPGLVQVPVRVQSLGEESQVVSLTFRTPPTAPGERFDALEPRLAEFPGVPVDATTLRLLLPEDREYAFSGNLDPVEEVEVAIARAEAYVQDVSRLRSVLESGTSQQQSVAADNLMANSRELRETLDIARARMAELEQAAAEGRVDREQLLKSRKQAEELTRNIATVLQDVEETGNAQGFVGLTATTRGTWAGADMPQAEIKQQEVLERWATKEGQAGKRWGLNSYGDVPPPDAPEQSVQVDAVTALDEEGVEAERQARAAQDAFDVRRAVAFQDETKQTIGIGGGAGGAFPRKPQAPADSGGAGPTTGGGDDGGPTMSSAYQFEHGAGEVGGRVAFDYRNGGGGGGGGARLATAPSVAGLVSLEPPLVERGRAYAFRKIDAGAEIAVSTRAPGRGRRAFAGLAFLLIFALVTLLRRRAARRRASA